MKIIIVFVVFRDSSHIKKNKHHILVVTLVVYKACRYCYRWVIRDDKTSSWVCSSRATALRVRINCLLGLVVGQLIEPGLRLIVLVGVKLDAVRLRLNGIDHAQRHV